MGRIHPKKGCDLVLQAFAAVLACHPNWHLVMAGPDQKGWQSSLELLAANLNIASRVTWTGMVSGNLKWGLIKSSEALFLPSHQENFGIVVAEALACGVPALISDKVNIWREVVTDGAGFAAPDDLPGASALLAKWSSLDPRERGNMRIRAHQCFENRFNIHLVSDSLAAIFSEIRSPIVVSTVGASPTPTPIPD